MVDFISQIYNSNLIYETKIQPLLKVIFFFYCENAKAQKRNEKILASLAIYRPCLSAVQVSGEKYSLRYT